MALITSYGTHICEAKPESFSKISLITRLFVPIKGPELSCGGADTAVVKAKLVFNPKQYRFPTLPSSFRIRGAQKARRPIYAAAAKATGLGLHNSLLAGRCFFVDILHFFSLSPVAAVANKSLSASGAWNCARSSWRSRRSPGATPDPASKNRDGFEGGFWREAWAQPGEPAERATPRS